MSRKQSKGIKWLDYDEYGNPIEDAPIGRTQTGNTVSVSSDVQALRNEAKARNKNAFILDDYQLGTSTPFLNGRRIDPHDSWPSTDKDYYQSRREHSNARYGRQYEESLDPNGKFYSENVMGDEPDPRYEQWKLQKISEDGKKGILCNLTTGQCMIIALAASAALAYFTSGGASRRKRLGSKKQLKNTRRHRKK
jgi:hypothetical protein